MAESILLHFGSASASEVLSRFAVFAQKVPEREGYFYPSNPDYLLLVTPYEDYAREYDQEEQAVIQGVLGAEPLGSVVFELRRSRSDAACDAAVEIITRLSREFSFVIDDCSRIWSVSDALETPEFLREYRYSRTE